MKIGIFSPIVTHTPNHSAPWEKVAGIAELATTAEVADTLGYEFMTCSEHVLVGTEAAAIRGGTYWDPLATLGYLAARTSRLRLATSVLVLGYHHPLAIAKRYGTLDVVSGGRLILGLGVGTLREEFEILGAEFEKRGEIADDALRALRASLSQLRPTYDGPHFSFRDVVIDPPAVQSRVPLWIGGQTRRSLRRAVELADGWMPFNLAPETLGDLLRQFDLPAGFDVLLMPDTFIDPEQEPAATADALGKLVDAGATQLVVRISARSADHYCDQLRALAELASVG